MSTNTLVLIVLVAAALILAICFGAILWRIGRLRRSVAAARSWPRTPGRIVAGAIREFRITLPRGGTVIRFGAILSYEYTVSGRGYRSDRFNVDGPQYFSSHRRAEATLARFPAGTTVTVFHDPAQPDNAVLAHQAPSIGMLWFVLAMTFTIAAVLLGGTAFEVFGRDLPFGPERAAR